MNDATFRYNTVEVENWLKLPVQHDLQLSKHEQWGGGGGLVGGGAGGRSFGRETRPGKHWGPAIEQF